MSKKSALAFLAMYAALRTAKRVIAEDRAELWEDFTIAPDRSFDHMNNGERAMVRRLDRALVKINAALKAAQS
jgi:hypothetical protein